MDREDGKLVKEIVAFVAVSLIFFIIECATGERDDDDDDRPHRSFYIPPPAKMCLETRPDGISTLVRCKTGSGSDVVPTVPQP